MWIFEVTPCIFLVQTRVHSRFHSKPFLNILRVQRILEKNWFSYGHQEFPLSFKEQMPD